jgi:hypothetical protein
MKTNYTPNERRQLVETNINAAFDYLEGMMDHPEKISSIPDEAIVIVPTGNQWVNQQNENIAAKWAEEENRPIYHV